MNGGLVDGIVAVVVAAGLGSIAWFFRQWANDLGDKVDHLSDKVDSLDEKVDTAINELGQVKVVVGWPPQLRQTSR